MSTLSSACYFIMGLGKPQLHAKFEVASPSRCRNIIGEPQHFQELPSLRTPSLFSLGVILWWALVNPSTKYEVASFSSCRNIKGEAPNFGEHPWPRATPTFFLPVGFHDGPWQTAAACQIWNRWLHSIRKYENLFLTTNSLFEPPFRELGVTYGHHL